MSGREAASYRAVRKSTVPYSAVRSVSTRTSMVKDNRYLWIAERRINFVLTLRVREERFFDESERS